jgi:hypothetical protein
MLLPGLERGRSPGDTVFHVLDSLGISFADEATTRAIVA